MVCELKANKNCLPPLTPSREDKVHPQKGHYCAKNPSHREMCASPIHHASHLFSEPSNKVGIHDSDFNSFSSSSFSFSLSASFIRRSPPRDHDNQIGISNYFGVGMWIASLFKKCASMNWTFRSLKHPWNANYPLTCVIEKTWWRDWPMLGGGY